MARQLQTLRRSTDGGPQCVDLAILEESCAPAFSSNLDPILFAVGDVHGMAGLLDAMLAAIEREAERLGRPAKVVFLGDLVNRGPDTRKVLQRLIAGPWRAGHHWIALKGNHEVLMLQGLLAE